MELKDLKKEDLELISYDDLAYLILKDSKRKMKISDLFKKICKTLKLGDEIFETKIADFFELLSTDRKFIMLENGYWDLRDRHTNKIKIETDDDEISDPVEKIEEDGSTETEDIFYEADETDDRVENDLKDLVVVSDEDEEADSM